MIRLFMKLLFVIIALVSVTHCKSQSPALQEPVQELRMNLFLGQWQAIGPFPSESTSPLDEVYFENEADMRGGNVRFHRNQLYTWKRATTRLVDLQAVLSGGGEAENCVGYAWTQFVSDKDRKLRLGVAHDDQCATWLNGELVGRSTMNSPLALDQSVYDVDVRQGINTLLLKVTNAKKNGTSQPGSFQRTLRLR